MSDCQISQREKGCWSENCMSENFRLSRNGTSQGNFLQVAVCRGNFRSCDCPFTDILHIDKHLKKENDQIPFYDGCCRPDLDIPKILKYLLINYQEVR